MPRPSRVSQQIVYFIQSPVILVITCLLENQNNRTEGGKQLKPNNTNFVVLLNTIFRNSSIVLSMIIEEATCLLPVTLFKNHKKWFIHPHHISIVQIKSCN